MDELTIEDKKYLSSKRAAQVTGYAKDYVGQLCREGRVEARLVGRNWYILESSILEHRFGAEEDKSATTETKEELDATWKTPNYSSEPQQTVPELVSKPLQVSPTPRWPEDNQVVLSDMQSAWKEWFRNQSKEEKMLPDSSEMLLPEGENEPEVVLEPVQEPVEETDLRQFEAPYEEEPEEIHISRLDEPEEVPVHTFREPASYSTRVERTMDLSQNREEVVEVREHRELERPVKRIQAPRRSNPNSFAIQAVFISVACLAVVVAIIGSGFADPVLQNGTGGNPVSNFLGGVKTIENSK